MNDQKVAILSGGTGYLGSAIDASLKEAGWIVVAPTHEEFNVTDEKVVEALVQKTVRDFGRIDACIHAATAPIEKIPLSEVSTEHFDTAIDTAARGAYLLARAALPHMQRGSAFVGVTTKLLEGALMPMGAYIPAKYALFGVLRALAVESTSRGIRVFAVAPGFMEGGLNRGIPKAILDLFARKTGAGQTNAREVAERIRDLCSDSGLYPTSSLIAIPGETTSL